MSPISDPFFSESEKQWKHSGRPWALPEEIKKKTEAENNHIDQSLYGLMWFTTCFQACYLLHEFILTL